jgi:hypothetical protein
MMEFYALALLPLALSSLFDRNRSRSTAGFGFLAALAPVLAKGIGSLINHKKASNAAKTAEAQRKLEAQQADALAKQQWEGQQNAPGAQTARFKNTMQLGRLSGAMGGLDKLPPSIAKYYQSMRTMPEYSAQSSYVEPAKQTGKGWNFLGGVADALSYLDTSKLGKPKSAAPTGFGAGSSFGNEQATVPTAYPGGNGVQPLVGLTERLKAASLANPVYPPKG